jgi:hypothetical protein
MKTHRSAMQKKGDDSEEPGYGFGMCGIECAKMVRVLSALQETRGFLMFCKKIGLRVLSALRKTRGFLRYSGGKLCQGTQGAQKC